MSAVVPLGKFERVSVRDAWPTEGGNFTPWLAESLNIALLGEALNMGLEVEAVEQPVGLFRADILARAVDETEQHRVIIENQFAKTDHGHLGQILTYLAGIEGAKTIVWIAETVQSDHRAAIDWLNTNTSEEFSFFAIEIELWRIGNSPPAPRFNVVASPNDWTRDTRTATRQLAVAVTDRDRAKLAYWTSFAEYMKANPSTFRPRKPGPSNWRVFPIGRSGVVISAGISMDKQRVSVELYIDNDVNKAAFRALLAQREVIEREFGEPLDWQELPDKKATRIALYQHGVDPSDERQYPALHAWMLPKMDRFRSVFERRVKALPHRSAIVAADLGESSEE